MKIRVAAGVGLALGLAVVGCNEPPPPPPPPPVAAKPPPPPPPVEIDAVRLAAFQPLPPVAESTDNPVTDEKVALGRMLFFERRLSKNQDVSCNSCHGLDTYGVDGKVVSVGHKNQNGTRNSPSVYNAALHFSQFWDGRAASVEEQFSGPLTNPVEMASDEKRVLAVLNSMPEYVDAFKKAFPDDKKPVSIANAGKAVGAFERKLLTPGRWDKFLGGDKTALNEEEKKGLNTFLDSGCLACHSGAALGGTMYQKAGLVAPWPNQKDQGRFDLTKKDDDKMMFKTPSLRNVAKTAPYFHDGSSKDLADAVKIMAKLQLARDLSDDQAKSISAFLNVLTSDLPADLIKEPTLPASTKKTPKPDPS